MMKLRCMMNVAKLYVLYALRNVIWMHEEVGVRSRCIFYDVINPKLNKTNLQ